MTNFEKVGLFMKTFGQEVKIKAGLSTEKINKLRISLVKEELEEFFLTSKLSVVIAECMGFWSHCVEQLLH